MKLLQLILLVWLFYRLVKWFSADDDSINEIRDETKQKSGFRSVDESYSASGTSTTVVNASVYTENITYLSNDAEIPLPFSKYYRQILRLHHISDIDINIIEIACRIKQNETRSSHTRIDVEHEIESAIHYLSDEWKYRSHLN